MGTLILWLFLTPAIVLIWASVGALILMGWNLYKEGRLKDVVEGVVDDAGY